MTWLFILIIALDAAPATQPAAAPVVLRVEKNGGDFDSVQKAIDGAPEGAVIRIGVGTWEGSLKITRPVTLEGAGWEKTVIVASLPPNDEAQDAMQQLEEAARQAAASKNFAALAQLQADLQRKFQQPGVQVEDARGVEIRGMKIAAAGKDVPASSLLRGMKLVSFIGSLARMENCVVTGSPGEGIQISSDSVVEISKSLSAGHWGTGIVIGSGDRTFARGTVSDCDVRNCYYAGIRIGPDAQATIQRCRISGAAWHGIRYDDASPTITNNRIFGNARCGIYASGDTQARISQNLLVANDIACWSANKDSISGNTFVLNNADYENSGIVAVGDCRPTIERNVFFNMPWAIRLWSDQDMKSPNFGKIASAVILRNVFWQVATPIQQQAKEPTEQQPADEVPLTAEMECEAVEPGFVEVETENFALSPGSALREKKVGVADPLEATSPFPLQEEESAIIPDGPTREYDKWKQVK
jgi:parallel beta-helix repeat protein